MHLYKLLDFFLINFMALLYIFVSIHIFLKFNLVNLITIFKII